MFGFNNDNNKPKFETRSPVIPEGTKFSFTSERIKKLLNHNKGILKEKPQGETIREQALNFFDRVYGLDDIKVNLYRALISEENINTMLFGAPASSKSLFMKIIEEKTNDSYYYDASNSSGAGFIESLYNNQNAKVILIDEIGMLRKNDLDSLRGFLNDGRIIKNLRKIRYDFTIENCKVFATTNDLDFSRAIRSRFLEYHIPEYDSETFIKVVQFCLKDKLLPDTSEMIANVLLSHKIKDVRHAISAANLIHKKDTLEDIVSTIETMIKYKPAANTIDYN
jgi:Holliday junction DNA helicase RuvB